MLTIDDLPINQRREEIARAITNYPVVVVCGETGSGKTTQLPQICLAIGRGKNGLIGHTQPRRIAARSVASRIAQEIGCKLGETVGYQVRFNDNVSKNTQVKLMTDGILLAEIQGDPLLKKYDTIIVDEAHERSLNIDFILGYLAQLLPQRPDLKVIITSATIDANKFAEHFSEHLGGIEVPQIEVSGRTYPVETRYRPLFHEEDTGDDEQDVVEIDQVEGICRAVDELCQEGPGDILVFLAGERDIRDTDAGLKDYLSRRYVPAGETSSLPGAIEVIPLYARLTPAEQQRVFEAHELRRIILATNVAETSLTVPGIKYVIDPGLARISRYSNRTKVQRLPIEEVSQASAKQRAGRCGRTSPGIAIRLYSEENFLARPEFTEPEILRTSLASVILQMASLNLGSVADFPFIDSPDARAVRDGEQLLLELGALTAVQNHTDTSKRGRIGGFRLTKLGYEIARFPIDPALARMIIEANRRGCVSEVLVVVAALSMQDVRLRPITEQTQADSLHNRFVNPHSDFLTYLTLWRYLRTQQYELSASALRKLCQREFLHYLRWREWQDLTGQLRATCRELGIKAHNLSHPEVEVYARDQRPHHQGMIAACAELSNQGDVEGFHRSLLSGMLSLVGRYDQRKSLYIGTRGTQFHIWPGSGLANSTHDWVMSAELVETSRLFARNVAKIDPQWIIDCADHLIKRSYGEVFWSRTQAQAMIHERTTLYGLTITADQPVPLARLGETPVSGQLLRLPSGAQNSVELTPLAESLISQANGPRVPARELARQMFIREALVEGNCNQSFPFQKHNQKVLNRITELAQRTRQFSLVADTNQLTAFMAARVGQKVVNPGSFYAWWKRVRNPRLLNYRNETVINRGIVGSTQPQNYTSGADLNTAVADRAVRGEALKTLHRDLVAQASEEYPDTWVCGATKLKLKYHFDPGAADDGITVLVPLEKLGLLNAEPFEWLVPGLREELFVALIRGLPKELRKQLTPAPEIGHQLWLWWQDLYTSNPQVRLAEDPQQRGSKAAAKAEAELQQSLERLANWAGIEAPKRPVPVVTVEDEATIASDPETPAATDSNRINNDTAPTQTLAEVFIAGIDQLRAVAISPRDFHAAQTKLPSHLQIRFKVIGEKEATSHSLKQLQNRFAKKSEGALSRALQQALEQGRQSTNEAALTASSQPHQATNSKMPSTSPHSQYRDVDEAPGKTNRHQLKAAKLKHLQSWPCYLDGNQIDPLPEHWYFAGTPLPQPFGIALPSETLENGLCLAEIQPRQEEWGIYSHLYGYADLLFKHLQLPTKRITTRWNRSIAFPLVSSDYQNINALVNDLGRAAVLELLAEKYALFDYLNIGSWEDFSGFTTYRQWRITIADFKDLFEDRVYELAVSWSQIMSLSQELSKRFCQVKSLQLLQLSQKSKTDLQRLSGSGSIFNHWMVRRDLARYLQSRLERLEKAQTDSAQFNRLEGEYQHLLSLVRQSEPWKRYFCNKQSAEQSLNDYSKIVRAKILLEEYQVSLFAQPLGTKVKVSPKRIMEMLKA